MPESPHTTQMPEKRVHNFNEVVLGFSKKIAQEQAQRCLQCTEPACQNACPLGVDIPRFIRALRDGNLDEACGVIKETNPLPSVCGRICSAECEVKCVLRERQNEAVPIRALERFASDFGRTKVSPVKKEEHFKKVAVVGSGPAGLSAAWFLARNEVRVSVFESFDKPGGVLRYGVPNFRIPKKVLDGEIREIRQSGVEMIENCLIGQTKTIRDLLTQEQYDAVLIAAGAAVPRFLDIPGTHLGGVYYGEEFLMRVNLMKTGILSRYIPNFVLGEKIVVIGSGNTALDCARSALRLGRQVTVVFRRTEDEMRVRECERNYAKEEGVTFEPLVRPVEILAGSDNFAEGLRCLRMDYAELDKQGQWTLAEVPGSDFIIDADTIVIAIGHKPNDLIGKLTPGLVLSEDGSIEVDEWHQTSLSGVFACGNVVSNARPVVEAIASGRHSAEHILKYLRGELKHG